ncbi:MAG TPA: HNH endonuclease signature motif containing protein [Mucilaginibacter sp.]
MSKKKKIASADMVDFIARINKAFGFNSKINPHSDKESLVKYISRMSGGGHWKTITPNQVEALFQVAMSRDPVHLSDAKIICKPVNQSQYENASIKLVRLAHCAMKLGAHPLTRDSLVSEIQNEYVHKRYLARFRDKDFYKTREWKELRLIILSSRRACVICGSGPHNGKVLHVDHIKPRSLYPELSFEPSNLQILCSECNLTKSNVFQIAA